MKERKLVYGVGINDADYVVTKEEYLEKRLPSGRRKKKLIWACPYYRRWRNMLERCYSDKCQIDYPTYKVCSVYKEWLVFSNFRKWMVLQDWEGMELDKDVLWEGNKVYSPEYCVFIHKKINNFLISSGAARGDYLLGCHIRDSGSFLAQCNNPFIGKQTQLGLFSTDLEAHLAWKYQKHLYSIELANSEYVTDDRVKEILLHRYENYNTLEEHLS
jgi:hypothetical protein